MVRRGKVKYKDVVKKQRSSKGKKIQKKPKERKTFSLYKNNYKNKSKLNMNKSEASPAKKTKVETVNLESETQYDSSSSDDNLNELNDLLKTFENSGTDKKRIAIESSSESNDEDMSEDNHSEKEQESYSDGNDSEEHKVINDIALLESVKAESWTAINDTPDINELEESNIDLETEKEDQNECTEDPFGKHLFYDLHESLLESLQNKPALINTFTETWPQIGNIHIQIPKMNQILSHNRSFGILEKKVYASEGTIPKRICKSNTAEELFIKSQVSCNINKANYNENNELFSSLQAELFSIMNNYQDLYYPNRTSTNAEAIRFIYCLHAVNHIMKTRIKIIHHNAKLASKEDVPEEFRDQGLVRPKILMLLPFKDSAYKVIQILIQLILSEDKGNVINKNRFIEDYTGNELFIPKKNPKPEDYEHIFQGNTSDDFKIGITFTRKSLKLYSDFYSSDIILASPLGLRTIIGAEGEPSRDYDFLASIELLILDQTELFLMQNWDHVIHILNHMHLQPKDSHGTDFSRVRTWSLNGWTKYYRQTLIFSSIILPEINAIFNKKCCNYTGKVRVINPIQLGSISQVLVQVPHVFQRFDCQSVQDGIDARFDFFTSKVLPQQKESLMRQTLIFIPSYFDYVRVRNYFKKEDIGFVQICEYSKDAKVARARDIFFHGDAHFLLYTERYHFFNRKNIKGIRHIVFYQLPIFSHFYSEMCNLMQDAYQNRKVGSSSNMSVTVIYSKYDIHQLSEVVGSEKAAKMYQSDRTVHMMVTEND